MIDIKVQPILENRIMGCHRKCINCPGDVR